MMSVLVSKVADGLWVSLLPPETRDMWQLNWEIKQDGRGEILETVSRGSEQKGWPKDKSGALIVFPLILTVKVPEEQKSDDSFNYWLACSVFGLQCNSNLGCSEEQCINPSLLLSLQQKEASNVSHVETLGGTG